MKPKLLESNRGAGLFELSLCLLGGLLVDTFEHGARSAINDCLRFTEAEAGESAHLLDDLDLLLADSLEDDVEGILLLNLFDYCRGATGGRSGDGCGGGDLEGLLELLDELAELNERELLERLDQLFAGQFCHDVSPCFRKLRPAQSATVLVCRAY